MNLTDATSMPNQTFHSDNAHPLYIPPTAVQSHESQESQLHHCQSERAPESDLEEFTDSQNLLYSSPSFAPPSWSSWSSSHLPETYPDSMEFYRQPLSYPVPVQLGFDARSPLPWMESQMPNHEALPRIDGLSNSGFSPYVWPAEGYLPFDTDLPMVN